MPFSTLRSDWSEHAFRLGAIVNSMQNFLFRKPDQPHDGMGTLRITRSTSTPSSARLSRSITRKLSLSPAKTNHVFTALSTNAVTREFGTARLKRTGLAFFLLGRQPKCLSTRLSSDANGCERERERERCVDCQASLQTSVNEAVSNPQLYNYLWSNQTGPTLWVRL